MKPRNKGGGAHQYKKGSQKAPLGVKGGGERGGKWRKVRLGSVRVVCLFSLKRPEITDQSSCHVFERVQTCPTLPDMFPLEFHQQNLP